MTETASASRSLAALSHSLSNAHPDIVRGVNAKRRAMGLPQVMTRGNPRTPLRPAPLKQAANGGRRCSKTKAAKWAGLKLDAAIACGRLRMNTGR
jgi:hypothetical protein